MATWPKYDYYVIQAIESEFSMTNIKTVQVLDTLEEGEEMFFTLFEEYPEAELRLVRAIKSESGKFLALSVIKYRDCLQTPD